MLYQIEVTYNKPFDLWAIALLSAIVQIWVEADLIRLFFAIPLMFVFTGYAITEAMYPESPHSAEEKVLLSLGNSIAVNIVGGICLYWIGIPLTVSSWVIWLTGIVIFASIVALFRRMLAGQDSAHSLVIRINIRSVILFALAITGLVGAGYLSVQAVKEQPRQGFTQLWLLPSATSTEMLVTGIRSYERSRTGYQLEIQQGGSDMIRFQFVLEPGEEFGTTVPIDIALPDMGQVEARLYRVSNPGEVYRHVDWTNSRKGGK